MKEEDNIHQFFKKKLGQALPEEEDWNIPSDDIWNKAKAEFPKKKNRKPFFFLLSALGITSLALLFWYLNTGPVSSTNETPTKITTEQLSPIVEAQTDHSATPQTEIVSEASVAESSSNVKSSSAGKLPSTPVERSRHSTNVVESEPVVETKTNLSLMDKTSTSHENELNSTTDRRAVPLHQASLATTTNNNTNTSNGKKTKEANTLATTTTETLPDKNATPPLAVTAITDNSTVLGVERQALTLENCPMVNPLLVASKPLLQPKVLPFKSEYRKWRWEFGLSHAPLILNLEQLFEEASKAEEPNREPLEINISYWNVNWVATRRLNRSLSLTSGLYLAKFGLDFRFTAEEVFDEQISDQTFKSLLRKNSSAGSLTLNDASSDIDVEYLPGKSLMNGDTFTVRGNIPVRVNIVQFPLILNYHFGKGKVEGLLHAGISIDYFNSSISSLSLAAYKNDELITKPVSFKALNDHTIDFGLYAGAGMKYHLTDHLNVGLSANLNFSLVALSRYEFGLYYRL